jgi:hypothetical protein
MLCAVLILLYGEQFCEIDSSIWAASTLWPIIDQYASKLSSLVNFYEKPQY